MHFKAKAKELRTLVAELTSIARPDPKADVKAGVAFELEGTILRLRICDLQGTFYSERTLNVESLKEGTAVLELAHLNNMLSAQTGELEIDIDKNDNGTLKQGRTDLVLLGLPYDVPKVDAPDKGWQYNDEANVIATAISKANRNRDNDDDPRYAIGCIALQEHEGKLEVIGTNNNSISAVMTDMPFSINGDMLVVRPELATIIGTYEKDRNISLAVTEEGLWLKQNERLDLVSTVDEEYPNYHGIVDPDPIQCGILDKETCIRMKTVIQKDIVGTNQHGHVWFRADNIGITIGNERNHKQDIACSTLKLPPISMAADSLASILNMFGDDIEVSMSNDKEHLYLRKSEQFALLLIEENKDNDEQAI